MASPFDLMSTRINRHSPRQQRQVSLANIATAYLSERKVSPRSSSTRKPRRSTKTDCARRSKTNLIPTVDAMLEERLSTDQLDDGLFSIPTSNRNLDESQRSTMLSQEDHRLLISSSEWVEDAKDSESYISVFSRLGEAIQDSETYAEFVKKSFSIVFNTFIATTLLVLFMFFQVVLFFIGVKYLNDCPIQPNLPVYLLVVGSMGLVRVLNLLWKQFRRRRLRKLEGIELDQEEETDNQGSRYTDAVLNLFLLGWFLVGQYWTWSAYIPKFEFGLEDPHRYCHRNVYIFILVHISLVYFMFLAAIFFLIALTCCARFPHLIVKTPN